MRQRISAALGCAALLCATPAPAMQPPQGVPDSSAQSGSELPTATPTPRLGIGSPCAPDVPDACASGFCTDSVCCDSATCLVPERCDIFGSAGTCAPPLAKGASCAKNTDCEEPLICAINPAGDGFACSLPLQPTPTLIPFTPQPTAPPPTVIVCRGTCSCVGDCNRDGSVIIDELVTSVNIALGNAMPLLCENSDPNHDGLVTVDEVVTAVNSALQGCATPSPTVGVRRAW